MIWRAISNHNAIFQSRVKALSYKFINLATPSDKSQTSQPCTSVIAGATVRSFAFTEMRAAGASGNATPSNPGNDVTGGNILESFDQILNPQNLNRSYVVTMTKIKEYQSVFDQLNKTSSFPRLFSILWYANMPCFDTRNHNYKTLLTCNFGICKSWLADEPDTDIDIGNHSNP